jgi:lysophospholipase L1-like esterase
MRAFRLAFVLLPALVCLVAAQPRADETPSVAGVAAELASGQRTVRIVAFGDSITGVYYHTGGRRAWHSMLGLALEKTYPKAKVEMINAGISGHTSAQGLARIDADVLAKKPDLVVVMFGMNDVCRADLDTFRANMREIIARCRKAGAAVVLCTLNSVYENPTRPCDRVAVYAQATRDVAKELSVPLADCHAAYEDVRAKDPTAWRLLMSETIHPGMLGHKLFAEVIAETISGKRVSLADAPPPDDSLRFTLARLRGHEPVKIVAMSPYDKIVPEVLAKSFPDARFDVVPWPVEGRTLAQITAWGEGVRALKPNLVVVAIPASAAADSEEAFIQQYAWALATSLSFGDAEWDLVPILPSVAGPPSDKTQEDREALARRIVAGYDFRQIDRRPGDARPAADVVTEWAAQWIKNK